MSQLTKFPPLSIRKLSLSTKLTLLVVLPIAVTMAVTLPLTVTGLNRLESETSASRLDEEVQIIEQQFARFEMDLNRAADNLASDPELLRAVRSGNSAEISQKLVLGRIRLGLEHLALIDTNGRLLGQDHRFVSPLDSVGIDQFRDLSVAEVETTRVVATSAGTLLTAIKPLKDADGVLGAISVGRMVDDRALYEMNFERVNPVVLMFDNDGAVISSSEYAISGQEGKMAVLPDAKMFMMARNGQVSHGTAKFNDLEQRAAYAPIPGGDDRGVFGVSVSVSPAVGLRDSLIADYMIVMAPVAIIVLALGYLVSRAISLRILRLRNTAVEIGKGNLDVRIEESATDEVGTLAHEFNRMADSLHEKNLELGKINLGLETRVLERTQELEEANTQLLEMHSQVVRSEKLAAIGELSAGVAHDLRNPLGAIRNGIYYLNKKLGKSEAAAAEPRIGEFLNIIDERVTHCDRIITDLIYFARIAPPVLSDFNLNRALESALSSLEIPQNVSVDLEPVSADIDMKGDRGQLQRVFANLTQNALDAMPEGGTLSIGLSVREDTAEIVFEDTGQGIQNADIVKIFDPLYTTKVQGTGLGLSVCQQIVVKHGGEIEASSIYGKGSTFRVALPMSGTCDNSRSSNGRSSIEEAFGAARSMSANGKSYSNGANGTAAGQASHDPTDTTINTV